MGLFSSKKKITVATQVSRVVEDKLLPNSPRVGLQRALVQSGEIVDNVLEEMVNSVAMRADRMYDYAEQHYTHGLPSARIRTSAHGQAQIKATIEAIEGQTVDIGYSHFGPPNSLHIAWMKLVSDYGYNPATNQLPVLSAQKNKTVYLDDMFVVVPLSQIENYQRGALDQWGPVPRAKAHPWRPITITPAVSLMLEHHPIVAGEAVLDDFVRVHYVYGDTGMFAEPTQETLSIPIEGYDGAADYFHVMYTVGGVTKFWMYKDNSGTYPELDALFNDDSGVMGSFFPFAYFRYNKASEISNKTTEAYKTSKKMVKYLGIDYDTVAEAIDENPDITDVAQAMLVMAVPANTQNPVEQMYLFDFFNGMYHANGMDTRSNNHLDIRMMLGGASAAAQSAITIQDRRFKMVLTNSGIHKRRVGGVIGPVGAHSMAMGTQGFLVTGYVSSGDAGETYQEWTQQVKTHIYRRQVNVGQYDEIEVVGLQMLYYVDINHYVTADETDDILLVPLDRSITNDYGLIDREVLYSRSLHYVFNSMIITKIKWYQTGFFQFIMIVVAVFITVYTWGADGGSALGAALGAGGYSTAALIIIEQLVIMLLVRVAMKLFVKIVGVDLAILIAVVAAAYGSFQALQAGSLAGAPWAQELLQLASGLASGVSAVTQDLLEDLIGEATEFGRWATEQTKLLENAKELLEPTHQLSPFVIFGESPNDFYNRTVHSGNIGAMGIQAISNYVDVALTLPKLNDTLGEFTYA